MLNNTLKVTGLILAVFIMAWSATETMKNIVAMRMAQYAMIQQIERQQ